MNELKQEIKSRLLEKLDHSMEMEDEAVQELVENEVWLMGKETYIPLAEKKRLCREIYYAIRKYDVLQELLEDETVTEIMVNGPDHIFIEKEGRLQQWQTAFESEDKLLDVIQQIVAKANRVVNESSPIVDARLFGSRVHVVLPPVALNGPILTIRRFGKTPLLIPELLRLGSVSQEICTFLEKLVIAGYNIFISGGTGSGKTTFLNALSSFIPRTERIITIEDSAELQIQGNDNLVRLETRNANVEGCKPVTIRDLIRASLRMRPESIKIKKGKLKRKKKRIPIPHTFLQHILGNLIPLIRCEVVKIIEEADDLLSFFHSILHVESIFPINGICTQHSFPE